MENSASLRPLFEGQKTAMTPAIPPGSKKRVGSLRNTLKRALMGIGLITAIATASDSTEPAQAVSKEKPTFQEDTNTTVAASHNLLSNSGSSPTSITQETHQNILKVVPAFHETSIKKSSSNKPPSLFNIEAPEPFDEIAHFIENKNADLSKGNMAYFDPSSRVDYNFKTFPQNIRPPRIDVGKETGYENKQNDADHNNKNSHDNKEHKSIAEIAVGGSFGTNGKHSLAGAAVEFGFTGIEVEPVKIGGLIFAKMSGGLDQDVQAYSGEIGPIISYEFAKTSIKGHPVKFSGFAAGTVGIEHSKHREETANSLILAAEVGTSVEFPEINKYVSVGTGIEYNAFSTNPHEQNKFMGTTTVLVGHAF